MQRYAITFQIKPDTVEQVKNLLASYVPPTWVTPDGTRLLSTSVFVKDDRVVRMMEIDGSLASVLAHLARQPSVQQLERQLDQYLAEPRDISTPEGAQSFFRRAMMAHVTTRVATFEQAPA